jgi:signal transduction histidine kinase
VYFCVLEALQNVAKYAHAPAARVTLRQDAQGLVFTVADEGTGFDPATTPIGTGLQGITDRLAALGGTLAITSTPGHGTRITGQVPATQLTSTDRHHPRPGTETPRATAPAGP